MIDFKELKGRLEGALACLQGKSVIHNCLLDSRLVIDESPDRKKAFITFTQPFQKTGRHALELSSVDLKQGTLAVDFGA